MTDNVITQQQIRKGQMWWGWDGEKQCWMGRGREEIFGCGVGMRIFFMSSPDTFLLQVPQELSTEGTNKYIHIQYKL